jgi:hypothetical protein
VVAATAVESAGVLFAGLARARREGDATQARRLYQRLVVGHRGSREELTARVLVGQLALSRPSGAAEALDLFDAYLRSDPAGVLAEEARLGRALALGRLGRVADERAAWEELLRQHPQTVHEARARARLGPAH